MSETNTQGAFWGFEVRRRQLAGTWPVSPYIVPNATFGWFTGGQSGPSSVSISLVSRVDYNNDSVTASTRGPLTVAINGHVAVGTNTLGLVIAGTPPGPGSSTIQRITYDNDSVTAVNRTGTMGYAAILQSGTGNLDSVWITGGNSSAEFLYRIDYASDTSAALRAYTGPSSGILNAATGNSNFGWYGGGLTIAGGTSYTTLVSRNTWASDTSASVSRGPLPTTRARLSAVGNENFGWFSGGMANDLSPFTAFSNVFRVDYSNDGATASTRGSLSLPVAHQGAAGNTDFGWFGGGWASLFSTRYSIVDRVTYANDSVAASTRGTLVTDQAFNSAMGGFPG
jgi:hypothetical protein